MLSMNKQSKLTPEEVIRRANSFFGARGLGLKVEEEDKCNIYFEGGGGSVRITAATSPKGSSVDIETREWEAQAKNFMAALK